MTNKSPSPNQFSPPIEHHRKWNDTRQGELARACAALRHQTSGPWDIRGREPPLWIQRNALRQPRRRKHSAPRRTGFRGVTSRNKAGLRTFSVRKWDNASCLGPISPNRFAKGER